MVVTIYDDNGPPGPCLVAKTKLKTIRIADLIPG